jgi:hypothetical protein
MAVIDLDFGDCSPIELNSHSGKSPREGVLGKWWSKEIPRLSHSFSGDVLALRAFRHKQSVPFTEP